MPEVKTINTAFAETLTEMDNANIQTVEQNIYPIPMKNILNRINSVKGQFFSVDFARKNDKKVNGVIVEFAGSIRHMVCRRGVGKYVQGVQPIGQRKAEDSRNEVLTVWDVQVYQEQRKMGIDQETAGTKAYRRINMADVKAISIPLAENAVEQHKVRNKARIEVEVPDPV